MELDTTTPNHQGHRQLGLHSTQAGQMSPTQPQQQPAKKPTKKRIRIQTEKRKEQNRSNQRAFRQRRERYVKDLEVSHHNLRHLVTHQGGEIENLKTRLLALSGGKEGSEPTSAVKAALLAQAQFEIDLEFGSPIGSQDSFESQACDEDEGNETLGSPPGFGGPSEADNTWQRPRRLSTIIKPGEIPSTPKTPSFIDNDMAPAPIDFGHNASGGDLQQPWTMSAPQTPPLSFSDTTSSSYAGSWSDSLLPRKIDSAFEPLEVSEPFGAVESCEPVSYKWQLDVGGSHGSDFSTWLQQSTHQPRFCLPYQTAPGYVAAGRDTSLPATCFGSASNALGLENLFPNLHGSNKLPMTASPLQLLGRPITPFAFSASPANEYTSAP